MSEFDKHVVKFLSNKGQSIEGIFILLVDMIAREGNCFYIDHLILATKTKNMLGLSNFIFKSGMQKGTK